MLQAFGIGLAYEKFGWTDELGSFLRCLILLILLQRLKSVFDSLR